MHWPDGCSYVHADQPPRALRLGRAMVKHVCAVHPDLVRKADKDVRAQMRDGLVKATAPLIQDVVESKQHKEAVHAAWSKEKKRQRQRARGEARRGVQDEAGKAAEKSSRREDAFVLWLERKQEARERLLEERGKVRPPASSGRACAHARARARARAAALHKGVLPKRALLRLRLRLRLLRRNPPPPPSQTDPPTSSSTLRCNLTAPSPLTRSTLRSAARVCSTASVVCAGVAHARRADGPGGCT